MKLVTVIALAMSLAACRGPSGTQGVQGDKGEIGIQGPVGADGTVISTLQFCPGTPVYPSVFPEIGIVINGSIYAVYSTNGGFLTLLLPGRYTSNAVGSRCDFTVIADGTVSL